MNEEWGYYVECVVQIILEEYVLKGIGEIKASFPDDLVYIQLKLKLRFQSFEC